jgi:hypothetical protein
MVGEMPVIDPESLDWDMSDATDADLVVNYLVMAVEGCGNDEDRLEVVDETGRRAELLGVRRSGRKVQVVVRRS